MEDGSVTQWILGLKEGDAQAAQEIWERYFTRLIENARSRLQPSQRRVADEEDIAATAFEHLWQGLQRGQFPRLEDRDDLWQVLIMLTARRATDLHRRNATRRRHELGESALTPFAAAGRGETANGPTPEFAAEVVENLHVLLDVLGDDQLRQIALWRMDGFTQVEIAEKLGCVERTVARKLRMIRDRLEELSEESPGS